MAKLRRISLLWFVAFAAAFWLASCHTTREMPSVAIKSLSTGKLLKKIEGNAFSYDDFIIRRINCQFSGENTKTSFKISVKARRDKQILISVSKFNIPAGRVLLTPDSVKYVNYLERNYFVDDYSYLSNFLNIDLDFATIQSILANNAFSYRNDRRDKDFRTFDSSVENGMYVLQSEKEQRIARIEENGKTGRIDRRLKRLDVKALILQKMFFNPHNFALEQLLIEDKTNQRKMEMVFKNFEKVGKREYPAAIDMYFSAPDNNLKLKLRMAGFSTESIDSVSLNIPLRYQRIQVNR
ncbi:MAG: hypothetical protein CSA36_04035 [Draconibacterium sp.]|nr:MAG: hypothetical protein CSA36_04035 [Draconibacterium sp.]